MNEIGRWRIKEASSEGRRNLGGHSWPQAVLTVLLLAGLGMASFSTTSAVLEREDFIQRNGAYVWVVTLGDASNDSVPLSARRCVGLGAQEGVITTGYIAGVAQPQIWAPFEGGPGIPSRFVSPHFPAVYNLALVIDQPLAGQELGRLGLLSASQRVVNEESAERITVEAFVTTALPVGSLNSAILIPMAARGLVDECHVRMDRASYHFGPDIIAAAFPQSTVSIVPFRDATMDLAPATQLRNYLNLAPGLLTGLLISVTLLGFTFFRRAQLMVYRVVGTRRSELGVMLSVEHGVVIGLGAIVAIPLTWVVGAMMSGAEYAPAAAAVAGLHILSAAGMALASFALGASFIVGGDPVAALRER